MKQIFMEEVLNQVRTRGDCEALVDQEMGMMTFSEMWNLSGKVYQYLINHGIGREDVVVIRLPRNNNVCVAMVGVMRAGAAFTILEEGYVPDRVDYIIKDSGCKLIIDRDAWAEIEKTELTEESAGEGYREVDLHDAAYIVYTSGSTGNPKGVLHEYGSITYLWASVKYEGNFLVFAGDSYALIAPLNTVAAVTTFLVIEMLGASTHILPTAMARQPDAMQDYITKHHITGAFFSPTVTRIMRMSNMGLSFIALGSEPANGVFIDNCTLMNYYCSSETGCHAMSYMMDKAYPIAPIGTPQFDIDYKVIPLDEGSEDGELCVYLPYTRGYLNLPEETARVFKDHWYHTGDIVRKEDGKYFLIGRVDDMFKVNGNRVEPAEIEVVAKELLKLPWVAVKGFEEGMHTYICLYYLNATEIDPSEANKILAEKLPYYMIPSYYIKLDSIPFLPGGKINRKALLPPENKTRHGVYVEPENDTERTLCRAFSRVLSFSPYGAEDDFYILGGDSLATMEAIDLCHLPGLTMDMVLRGRTPRKITQIYRQQIIHAEEDIAQLNQEALAKPHPLTVEQKYMLEYQKLNPGYTTYDLYGIVKYSIRMDMERLAKAVTKAFSNHPALMTTFERDENGELVQIYHADMVPEIIVENMSQAEFEAIKDTLVKPLDLIGGRPYVYRLFKTEVADYSFFHIHHSLIDGTSFNILLQDTLRAYYGKEMAMDGYYLMLKEREDQEKTAFYEEGKEYYKNRYDGIEWSIRPEEDMKSDENHIGVINETFDLTVAQTEKMSKMYNMGRNGTLVTALALAVAAYNNKKDVMVSWVHNGRKSALEANVVGLLYKQLPLGLRLDEKQTLVQVYEDVRDQMVRGVTYSNYPYCKLGARPVEDDKACFLLQNGIYDIFNSADGVSTDPVEIENKKVASYAMLDMEVVHEEEKAYLKMSYNASRYKKESIDKFKNLYLDIVRTMIEKADDESYTVGQLLEAVKDAK